MIVLIIQLQKLLDSKNIAPLARPGSGAEPTPHIRLDTGLSGPQAKDRRVPEPFHACESILNTVQQIEAR
jgi:hypothetical protein